MFLVWKNPSTIKKQKIGKAIRPIARNIMTSGNNIQPIWSISIVVIAIIFKVKLSKIPTDFPFKPSPSLLYLFWHAYIIKYNFVTVNNKALKIPLFKTIVIKYSI